MTSSRYATGRVCQVVAGDSVKCTKMASVHEKTVTQVSVVAYAKWSLTQVLLYCSIQSWPCGGLSSGGCLQHVGAVKWGQWRQPYHSIRHFENVLVAFKQINDHLSLMSMRPVAWGLWLQMVCVTSCMKQWSHKASWSQTRILLYHHVIYEIIPSKHSQDKGLKP